MSYIGKSPIVGNFQVCDAISVVNGQAAYTMQVGSANVSPESANNMIVSLNGVIQKPNTAYTISGATITFASNLASGDVIDFIQLLGDVLDIGTPSDGTVTSGKLASNSVITAKITDANVTGAKTNFVSTSSAAGLQIKGDGTTDGTLQLNCSQNSHGIKLASPAHSSSQSYTLKFPTGNVTANKFLKVASVSGSGTSGIGQLSFADAGGGITVADQWRLTTNLSASTTGSFVHISSNLARVSSTGQGTIGTAMSESNGTFSFPSTGIYLVNFQIQYYDSDANTALGAAIDVSVNNGSSYANVSQNYTNTHNGSNVNAVAITSSLIDVTSSSVKIRFYYYGTGATTIYGTSTNSTFMTFTRLGDT